MLYMMLIRNYRSMFVHTVTQLQLSLWETKLKHLANSATFVCFTRALKIQSMFCNVSIRHYWSPLKANFSDCMVRLYKQHILCRTIKLIILLMDNIVPNRAKFRILLLAV